MTATLHPPLASASAPPLRDRRIRMTEAEFFALPESRVEYVDGEAVFMSPVSLPHARVVLWFGSYMDRLSRKTPGGTVFPDSVTVRLSPNLSRVPDLTYVKPDSRAVLRENHIDGPPDLIVEIVSPESRIRDYHEKHHDYESAGVTEYWIVDPTYQTVDLFRLTDGRYTQIPPDAEGKLVSAVLPGLFVRAEWLKQTPLPDPATLG